VSASFLLTFDVELLWGVFFDEGWRRRGEEQWAGYRRVFGEILTALDAHDVRATFAFVGHLCLDRCERVEGRVHPEMPRPEHEFFDGDWYEFDPATDRERDPLWYAPDLVTAVRDARAGHEIGGHGFSHAFLDGSRELARAEILATADALRAFGVEPRSFVYPRNVVAFTDELAPAGFTRYREGARNRRGVKYGSRAMGLLRKAAGARPPVGRARRVGDLVEVPAGIPILPAVGLRRVVSHRARLREVAKGLDRARREHALFHLWTHPHNFVEGREVMVGFLDGALELVAKARDRGDVSVLTMGEVEL
jgi:peptidoglycan/xylan/chitin deacetylase (PgdA/CDA1 family)